MAVDLVSKKGCFGRRINAHIIEVCSGSLDVELQRMTLFSSSSVTTISS